MVLDTTARLPFNKLTNSLGLDVLVSVEGPPPKRISFSEGRKGTQNSKSLHPWGVVSEGGQTNKLTLTFKVHVCGKVMVS